MSGDGGSSGPARVLDTQALERFKGALAEFKDRIGQAISEADSDIERTILWLEREQRPTWERRIRRSQEELVRAKGALFRKQTQGSSKDGRPSVVDEKIMVQKMKAKLRRAEEAHAACRKWAMRLQREMAVYKGAVAPLATAADRDLPEAIAVLNRMMDHLDAYLRGDPKAADTMRRLLGDDARRSMKRSGGEPEGTAADQPSTSETTVRDTDRTGKDGSS